MMVEMFTSGCSFAVLDHVVSCALSQGKPERAPWPLAAVQPPDLQFVLLVLLSKKSRFLPQEEDAPSLLPRQAPGEREAAI